MHFEELLQRISPTLKKITYKLNGHFSFFNDEDLFQEALVHLWDEFQQGKLNDKTDSYILQGCYFHLKNYLRKSRDKLNLVSIDSLVNNEENMNLENILIKEIPSGQDFISNLDNKMLLEIIQNNGLTHREKEIVSLCLENLTTRQMGERLGISHVRVVKLRKRIKDKCQRYRDKF